MDCFFDKIRSPSISSLMDGLRFQNGDLDIVPDSLLCCAGSGLLDVGSRSSGSVKKCDLMHRLANTRKLYQVYYKHWGKSFPLPPDEVKNKTSDQAILTMLEFFRSRSQAKLLMTNKSGAPSEVWPMALMASWHLGYKCHVVRFDMSNISQILPRDEFMTESTNEKSIIFVEQIQKLFEPNNAEKLEQLVSYAYNADCLLVLDFIYKAAPKDPLEQTGRPRGFSTRGSMRRYAERLRSKHPIEYLRDDCVSRMEMMVGTSIR